MSKTNMPARLILSLALLLWLGPLHAQPVKFAGGTAEARAKFIAKVQQEVQDFLSQPLTPETEDDWIRAFHSINYFNYHTPFTAKKTEYAVSQLSGRSPEFQKALAMLLYANFPGKYTAQMQRLANETKSTKTFAIAANYVIKYGSKKDLSTLERTLATRAAAAPDDLYLKLLKKQLSTTIPYSESDLKNLFSGNFLPGKTVVYSLQNSNRDYPGLAVVRNADGSFVKDSTGGFFSVPQLTRSSYNLPYYISLGNTPQGIFRMDGFDTSKNYFIGPTTNIQLTMPNEFRASHFYMDSTLVDSVWDISQYQSLLPNGLQNSGLLESFYAGKAGRDEIIAHGTTLDPELFRSETYYPFTPTSGCLATEEWWDGKTGYLQQSGQLRLTNAVAKAGGPYGYLLVINVIADARPVSISDVEKFMR